MFAIKKNFKLLFTIFLCVATGVLLFDIPVTQGGPYLDSAHGNSSSGVDRTSTNMYTKGHCAHCHEQHASINGAQPEPKDATPVPSKFCLLADNFSGATANPYVQSNSACFYCHYGTGTLQNPAFSNYSYSITFGGNPDTTPATIFDAFDSASYHNLNDVYKYITGASGSKAWSNFPADSNPCSGCHNVHIAKQNKANPGDPSYTAISKPSIHGELWGDDVTTERMSIYAGALTYQAPYYYALSTYEPDNSITTDGSNLPDYVSFCTDCHNATNVIVSATLGTLKTIDWTTTGGETGGDKHGKNAATVGVDLDAPYAAVWGSNGLVLACTDCHEPHGAPNVMLIRKEVNGGVLGTIDALSTINWQYLCARCHNCDSASDSETIHHLNADAPYDQQSCSGCHGGGGNPPPRIPCNNCHFHGGDDSWLSTVGETPTGRRTF